LGQIITIVGLIILSVIITAGGGPNHESIGFRFWHETGGFMQFQGIGESASSLLDRS
jgi:amino acid transporter